MRTLTLTIPAPCEWINSNQREHWARKANKTRDWRYAAFCAASAVSREERTFTRPVRIECTAHKTRGGRFDVANLYGTFKAIVDGLVDAGVIPDDSNQWVTGPDMRAGEKRDKACVVITVTEVTA